MSANGKAAAEPAQPAQMSADKEAAAEPAQPALMSADGGPKPGAMEEPGAEQQGAET